MRINKMMNKYLIILLFILLACFSAELKADFETQSIKFDEEQFGINFKTITIKQIIKILNSKNIEYTAYDDKDNEITDHSRINEIFAISTRYFIGKNLDKSQIKSVYYETLRPYEPFRVIIEMKIEYYDQVYRILCNKFGENNCEYNSSCLLYYWYGDKDYAKKHFVNYLSVSKGYDYYLTGYKPDSCYLSISTRDKKEPDHVH